MLSSGLHYQWKTSQGFCHTYKDWGSLVRSICFSQSVSGSQICSSRIPSRCLTAASSHREPSLPRQLMSCNDNLKLPKKVSAMSSYYQLWHSGTSWAISGCIFFTILFMKILSYCLLLQDIRSIKGQGIGTSLNVQKSLMKSMTQRSPSTGNHRTFFLFWILFLKHQFISSLYARTYSYWQLTQRTLLFVTDQFNTSHKKNRAKVRCLLRPSFQTIIYISLSVNI